jgi:hypothetical protein
MTAKAVRASGRRIAGALGFALIAAALPVRAAINPDLLPPKIRSGDVTYLSGGISRQQESAIERAAPGYPLELRFLASGPAYGPAYVPVTIRDRAGKVVLDAASDGPMMLADVPDGRYSVTARHAGKTETLEANVQHGKHRMLAFDWKY